MTGSRASDTKAGASSKPASSSSSSRLNRPNSLGIAPDEERGRVELAGVERRRRVAALPDRAERAGDALTDRLGATKPPARSEPAGEVDGRRRALEGEDQLTGVGRARHRLGVEGAWRQPVGEVRLGVDEVDSGRLRRQVSHRRHDASHLGEERPRRHVVVVDLAVEDKVADLDRRVTGLHRLGDGERLPAALDLPYREVRRRRLLRALQDRLRSRARRPARTRAAPPSSASHRRDRGW